ncbi:MAG: T9SS type A sorting domain-containing protein, partial [Flavobacteriales bacterium]
KAADGTGKIYVDGQLKETGTFQNNNYDYTSLYLAASYYTSWSDFFKGWIDEFRMSNVVRTDSEIANNYSANTPLSPDSNTIGLWHFDESSGTTFANSVGGNGDLYNGAYFTTGKFGNAVYFDGVDDRGNCNLNIPEDDITFEFWVKLDGKQEKTMIQPYGIYSSNIYVGYSNTQPTYVWSTGDTASSITIDPAVDSVVWVSDSNCTDTLAFYQNTATVYDTVIVNDTNTVTVYDTLYTSVTDTLIIDVYDTLTNVPNANIINNLNLYPNPAKDKLNIDLTDSTSDTYQLKIINNSGQIVYSNNSFSSSDVVDISSYPPGLYFFEMVNGGDVYRRKIVVQ